jgi:hypothetical protein
MTTNTTSYLSIIDEKGRLIKIQIDLCGVLCIDTAILIIYFDLSSFLISSFLECNELTQVSNCSPLSLHLTGV